MAIKASGRDIQCHLFITLEASKTTTTYPGGTYPYVEKPGEKKGGSNPKFRWRVPLGGWEGIITRRAAGGGGTNNAGNDLLK